VAVDVADPKSEIVKQKRKLLFKNGLGYLCVPVGFTTNREKLTELYKAALDEYNQYEKLHPRPAQIQEAIITDSSGKVRKALLTAMDIGVGGHRIGNVETQQRELMEAKNISPKELKSLKSSVKLRRKVRECLQAGVPFRNPFVAPGKRKYSVQYGG